MTEQREWSIDFASGVLPTSAADGRHFVDAHLRERGLAYLVDDVVLVVSELVTNALVHSGTPCALSLEVLPDSVLVTVRDESSSRPYVVAAPDWETGGRGMRIVELLSREWGVTPRPHGGKSVWASFDLGGGAG